MSACPPDEAFARLLDGRLSEGEVRELEVHADGCPTCARLLSELARASGGQPVDRIAERYRLLEPLGAGAMGVVYSAFDEKLGRKVAIKRLREAAPGSAEKRRARFLREAQLLASLSHPNVLTVFDVGGSALDLYVVMELVDGWPISRWKTEARPDRSEILRVYLQAGRGLAAAHELGIIHRDIKPDNILVARSGRVLVGDFGLASLVDTEVSSEGLPSPPGLLTQTGTVLGTPAYMSPEQHAGRAADAFSDQFSFCVALYETLHGRRPFRGSTAAEVVAQMREGEIVRGSDGVPRAIDSVIGVGLLPDPSRRFPSMAALLEALEKAQADRPGRRLALRVALAATIGAGTVGMWARLAPHPAIAVRGTTAVKALAASDLATPPQKGDPKSGGRPAPLSSPPDKPGPKRPPGASQRTALEERRPGQPAPDSPGSEAAGGAPRLVEEALGRAEKAATARDGATCLAELDRIATWPAEQAERAEEQRADCEMLRGNCEKGRKMLESLYAADRTPAGVSNGLLKARVSRMCPPGAFGTVKARILSVFLQADLAEQSTESQSAWCAALERQLFSDLASEQVGNCFRAGGADVPDSACSELVFDITEAVRHLSQCFLRDGNCQEGALLDVLHSEAEMRNVRSDDPRQTELWCRADTIREQYESCSAAGREAERRCLARAASARPSGVLLTPEPPR